MFVTLSRRTLICSIRMPNIFLEENLCFVIPFLFWIRLPEQFYCSRTFEYCLLLRSCSFHVSCVILVTFHSMNLWVIRICIIYCIMFSFTIISLLHPIMFVSPVTILSTLFELFLVYRVPGYRRSFFIGTSLSCFIGVQNSIWNSYSRHVYDPSVFLVILLVSIELVILESCIDCGMNLLIATEHFFGTP